MQYSQIANQLLTGEIDIVVFLTAAGVNYLLEQASRHVDRQRLVNSLADITSVAGSQYAAAACRAHGIDPTIVVDSPSSWREILIAMDRKLRVSNFNVGLEESDSLYGLSAGVEARGGRVTRIPVYPQSRPSSGQSAIEFFEQIEAGEFQAILFTSSEDVARFCYLAQHFGRARLTSHLLDNHIVICVGAEAAELLRDRQFSVDFQTRETGLPAAIEEIADQMENITNQKNDYPQYAFGTDNQWQRPQCTLVRQSLYESLSRRADRCHSDLDDASGRSVHGRVSGGTGQGFLSRSVCQSATLQ